MRKSSIIVAAGALLLLLVGGLLVWRADRRVNRVPLAGAPRPVTVVAATASTYRPERTYVGTLAPWIEADVGPQFLSAYVETVLVRPGDVVRRGQVLATLDCANASAATRASAMRARSVEKLQRALASEASRVGSLVDGGFAARNEAERKTAESDAERARHLEAQALVEAASLQVRDCVLRAPFAGEIADRRLDPGAFVRPGATIVSVVDRQTVRIVGAAPEKDFDVVAPQTPVKIEVLAGGRTVAAMVSRRAPRADLGTRTVHFEIDVADAGRTLPVGTTGVIRIEVGEPQAASEVPLPAATVKGGRAHLFVVEHGVARAHDVPVLGERGGHLYLDPRALPPGAHVVLEGRAQLADGNRVRASLVPASSTAPATDTRGGGYGRPL